MAYDLHGRGSDLAITVSGADVVDCLRAAVEGMAASIGDVHADADRRRYAVTLVADDPPSQLLELLDEAILRLDADGVLAVTVTSAERAQDRLDVTLEMVPLADVTVHGDPPKAATWHDLRLEPTEHGWRGQVLLDL